MTGNKRPGGGQARMLVVQKFGGTSVGTAERISRAAALALGAAATGQRVVVVTSAMSGVTNELVEVANRAARGDWNPLDRSRLYDLHAEVAGDLLAHTPVLRDAALLVLDQRLERLEKLCFGLSMVHELTPRLLD